MLSSFYNMLGYAENEGAAESQEQADGVIEGNEAYRPTRALAREMIDEEVTSAILFAPGPFCGLFRCGCNPARLGSSLSLACGRKIILFF